MEISGGFQLLLLLLLFHDRQVTVAGKPGGLASERTLPLSTGFITLGFYVLRFPLLQFNSNHHEKKHHHLLLHQVFAFLLLPTRDDSNDKITVFSSRMGPLVRYSFVHNLHFLPVKWGWCAGTEKLTFTSYYIYYSTWLEPHSRTVFRFELKGSPLSLSLSPSFSPFLDYYYSWLLGHWRKRCWWGSIWRLIYAWM